MLNKIDHIGIAVKSIAEVERLYKDIFNVDPEFKEEVVDQKVRALGIKVGESNLEFLEAASPDSVIAKYIQKRGNSDIAVRVFIRG